MGSMQYKNLGGTDRDIAGQALKGFTRRDEMVIATNHRCFEAQHLDDAVAALELSTAEIAQLGAPYVPHAVVDHR
jgi:hypothetical protein